MRALIEPPPVVIEELPAFPVESEFDAYSETYSDAIQQSIDFIGQDVDYFVALKARLLVDLARRRLGDPRSLAMLDVGCGVGATDRHLVDEVGTLHGVDICRSVVERAVENVPRATYRAYDGSVLPYRSGSFDVAFCVCVVHHVEPAARQHFFSEVARVVRPGGIVAVFEHNPINPLTRRAVDRCAFDADAVLVGRPGAKRLLGDGGLNVIEAPYIVFVPRGGTRVARFERALRWLPLGAQYYVAATKPDE